MSDLVRVKLPLALAIIVLASYVVFLEVEASDQSDEQIGASAVWDPGQKELQQIQDNCKQFSGDLYVRCFTDGMADLGASAEAVDFTQLYAETHAGKLAFLRGFRPMDAVDLGYTTSPGNESSQGWVLLNGSPEILNVDDDDIVSQPKVTQNPAFAALRASHPKAGIFADRAQRPYNGIPAMMKLPGGGQRFVVRYPIKDGCESCSLLGVAAVNLDFDAGGSFLGANLVNVEQQPPMK